MIELSLFHARARRAAVVRPVLLPDGCARSASPAVVHAWHAVLPAKFHGATNPAVVHPRHQGRLPQGCSSTPVIRAGRLLLLYRWRGGSSRGSRTNCRCALGRRRTASEEERSESCVVPGLRGDFHPPGWPSARAVRTEGVSVDGRVSGPFGTGESGGRVEVCLPHMHNSTRPSPATWRWRGGGEWRPTGAIVAWESDSSTGVCRTTRAGRGLSDTPPKRRPRLRRRHERRLTPSVMSFNDAFATATRRPPSMPATTLMGGAAGDFHPPWVAVRP